MAIDATARPTIAGLSPWLVGAALVGLAVVARAIAVSQVTAVPTVDSAYYVGVAGRLASGQGLTADVLWTYASPPLALPQPAFALWMPLASLLAAIPMVLGGTTSLFAAQLAMIVVGAALAPLTWYVADQAAAANGLTGRRRATVALGSGLVAALFGPFLVAVTGPDSSVPFAVLAVAACCAMPRALDAASGRRWGVALGVLLGLGLPGSPGGDLAGADLPAAPPARAAPARARRARRLAGPDPWPGRRRRRDRGGAMARSPGPGPWLALPGPGHREPVVHPQPGRLRLRPAADDGGLPGPGTCGHRRTHRRRAVAPAGRRAAPADAAGRRLRAARPGVGLADPRAPQPDGPAGPDHRRDPDVPGHGPPLPRRDAGRDVPACLRAGSRGPRGRRRAGDRPRRGGHRGVARLGQAERLAGAAPHARPGPAAGRPRGLAHRLVRHEPGGAGERGGGGPGKPGAGPGRRARHHQRRTDRLRPGHGATHVDPARRAAGRRAPAGPPVRCAGRPDVRRGGPQRPRLRRRRVLQPGHACPRPPAPTRASTSSTGRAACVP